MDEKEGESERERKNRNSNVLNVLFSYLGFRNITYVLKQHYHSCDNIIDVPFYSIKCHENVKIEYIIVSMCACVSVCFCRCCLLRRSI